MSDRKSRMARARMGDLRGKRRKILDGARRVFMQEGFIGAGVSKIAAEAGVSKRTLYKYFRSKEELFAEIVRDVGERIDAPIAPSSIESHRPRETLRQLAQATAEVTVRGDGPAFYRVIAAEAPRFPQLGRIFLEQAYELNAAHLTSLFSRWNAAGETNISNPKFAADLFFGMINSIRLRVLLGVAPSIGPAELREWLDFVVNVFWNGVGARPGKRAPKRVRKR